VSAPLNLYRLQNFVAHALLCTNRLREVNIVTREALMQPDSLAKLPDRTLAAEVLAYITPRNKGTGRKGACVIVETPEIVGKYPSAPGQTGDIDIECLILEDPMSNNAAQSGTLMSADAIGQVILDVGKHWMVDGYGIFSPPTNAWARDDKWQPLRAIKVRLRTTAPLGQSERCAPVVVSVTNSTATLTCAEADSVIHYTFDGSFPGPSNSAAMQYTEPLTVISGDTLLAAATVPASDINLSRITRYSVA
jgi:hypothetical protein